MKKILLIMLLAFSFCFGATLDEFESNCHKGDAEACSGAGLFYLKNLDISNAILYLEKGCDLHSLRGCDARAILYLGNKNYKKSNEIFEQTCKLNSGTGCYNIGTNYLNGENGYVKDEKKGKEYILKACQLKNLNACGLLNNF